MVSPEESHEWNRVDVVIRNGEDYRESLRGLGANVWVRGERVGSVPDHPAIRPHVNAAAMTYDLALDPELAPLFLTESHLSGEKVSRFTQVDLSPEDIVNKAKMLRELGRRTGTCFQRCVGADALRALFMVTYEVDEAKGTDYHERFLEFLRYIQATNKMATGSMTDPKGDRSLRPAEQPDPDQFVRVVERKESGIIVRGAKVHQTGAANSHEFIVLPTCAMTEDERDYAVAFAVPANAAGITIIFGRQAGDLRRYEEGDMDLGNAEFGVVGGESTIVFENVFVPRERVFLCGEWDMAGKVVEYFATIHRQNYGGCKAGVADVLIGAAAELAELQGTGRASHVRDKLTEMVFLTETLYACSMGAACEAVRTNSGAYLANPLLANVLKHNVTRHMYEIDRLAHDLAGGFIATMPAELDLRHPTLGPLVEKYYRGAEEGSTERRMRLGRLIENMTTCTPLLEAMHGAGSPQAQRIMILRGGDIAKKRALARGIAGLEKEAKKGEDSKSEGKDS